MNDLTIPIAPAAVRYIKLGAGGAFARDCIEAGELGLSFRTVPHEPCVAGDWEDVRRILLAEEKSPAAAASHLRELQAFYELGADTLWVTFFEGRLWWAFAEPGVRWDDANRDSLPRRRKIIGATSPPPAGGASARSCTLKPYARNARTHLKRQVELPENSGFKYEIASSRP